MLVVDTKYVSVIHPLPGSEKLEADCRLIEFTPQVERDRRDRGSVFLCHSGASPEEGFKQGGVASVRFDHEYM
jgi:hypothetical protein